MSAPRRETRPSTTFFPTTRLVVFRVRLLLLVGLPAVRSPTACRFWRAAFAYPEEGAVDAVWAEDEAKDEAVEEVVDKEEEIEAVE